MAKIKSIYVCQTCGAQSGKWMGRCADCGEWNAIVEQTAGGDAKNDSRRFVPGGGSGGVGAASVPLPIDQVSAELAEHEPCGMPEFDRVLGGGLVPGSLVLLGGDPGIGKSTIALQVLGAIAQRGDIALYVSGEESAAQVRSRAARLSADESSKLFLLSENAIEAIAIAIDSVHPRVLVIDSIQTTYAAGLESAPGTVSQLRDVTMRLLQLTKSRAMTTLLIGHVTKEGMIAGPKVLEHMVDTVLYFEGERSHQYRILRAVKNRFGSTNEIGVFEMTSAGLAQVTNPSALFLQERAAQAPGSVVIAPLEGTRPLLVELQALVASSGLANPRRTVIGVDASRVGLLAAVLDKVVGVQVSDQDIFVNVAGGLKVNEPASDLGIVAAIASSLRGRAIPASCVVIGEIGLTGEVRAVSGLDVRLGEAAKLGFTRAVIPQSQLANLNVRGLELLGVRTVAQALDAVLG